MDCNKAQDAMMQYMDKKIKSAAAAALARHVLKCDDCRERFLLFDGAMDAVNAINAVNAIDAVNTIDAVEVVATAPDGFTEAVMAKVRKLPPHVNPGYGTRTQPAPTAAKVRAGTRAGTRVGVRAETPSAWGLDMSTRVIAGVCVILLGVALLLTYNHEALSAVMAGNATLYAVMNALRVSVQFFDHSFNWLVQASSHVTGLVSEVGYMSLALVLMSGAVLFVMQRGEHFEHE